MTNADRIGLEITYSVLTMNSHHVFTVYYNGYLDNALTMTNVTLYSLKKPKMT